MFDRFTDRARKVIGLARQTAVKFNIEYIGGEHILIGLALEGSGVAANALRNLDVSGTKLEDAYKEIYGAGPSQVSMGQLPFTPVAKRILEYSVEEASNLGHNYIGTEHLALGISRIDDGQYGSVRLLAQVGITPSALRMEVLALLGADMSQEVSDAVNPNPLDPVVTLLKRRLDLLETPWRIEKEYGPGFSGPRLAVIDELKSLLKDVERLKA